MVVLGGTFFENTIAPIDALIEHFYGVPGRAHVNHDAVARLNPLLWTGDIEGLIAHLRSVRALIEDGDRVGLDLWRSAVDAVAYEYLARVGREPEGTEESFPSLNQQSTPLLNYPR